MDNKNTNVIIIGSLIAFLVAVVVGSVVVGMLLAPANDKGSGNGANAASGTPGGGGAGASAKPAYAVRQPNDLSFSTEIPPNFSYQMNTSREALEQGGVITLKTYTAGGGKGVIDGFAVIRMIDLVDKRGDEFSRDEFLKEIIDRTFAKVNCKMKSSKEIRRTPGDGFHCEGNGWEADRGRAYCMALEGLVVENDIYILFVAGFTDEVFNAPATAHFFETFALTSPE